MALSVGTGVQCHPSRDTPFCWQGGTREGAVVEKAGMGLEEGFWVLVGWGAGIGNKLDGQCFWEIPGNRLLGSAVCPCGS